MNCRSSLSQDITDVDSAFDPLEHSSRNLDSDIFGHTLAEVEDGSIEEVVQSTDVNSNSTDTNFFFSYFGQVVPPDMHASPRFTELPADSSSIQTADHPVLSNQTTDFDVASRCALIKQTVTTVDETSGITDSGKRRYVAFQSD